MDHVTRNKLQTIFKFTGITLVILFALFVSGKVSAQTGSLIHFDNFEYTVNRADPNACSIFINMGWEFCKVQPTPENYIFTTTSIPGFSGSFPGQNSSRVVAYELWGSRGQTDSYLQIGHAEGTGVVDNYIPGDVWFQFWIYPNYSGSQMTQMGTRHKLIYPTNSPYPSNTNKWLFHIGTNTYAPLYTSSTNGDVHIFNFGNAVGNIDYQPAQEIDQSKIGQFTLSERIRPNRWNLVKVHFDTSNANTGKFEAWIMPQGGQFTKVVEWIGGVTPEFTWTQTSPGGHRALRFLPQFDTDAWLYFDDIAMASSESALPTYGGSTIPPPPVNPPPPPPPPVAPPPSGDWVFCANENNFCTFSGTREVRYGANNIFVYRTFSNGVGCSNDIFGDPVPNVVKQCHYSSTTPLAGDLNLDHIINSIDFSILNSRWFTSDATADINRDGIVNSLDFSIMNGNWFRTW